MEGKTIRNVAYKCKKTIEKERKGFLQTNLKMIRRFPRPEEYPQYTLIPGGTDSKKRVRKAAVKSGRNHDGHNSSVTIETQRNVEEDSSNRSRRESPVENDTEVKEQTVNKKSFDDCSSDEMSDDEMGKNNNDNGREIDESKLGNYNSNCMNSGNVVENENYVSEIESDEYGDEDSEDSSPDEGADETGNDNENQSDNTDVVDNGDVDDPENVHNNSATFALKQGPWLRMRMNIREHVVLISVLALGVRHCLNMITILSFLKFFKKIYYGCTLPTTKKGLWNRLGKKENNVQTRHLYCRKCLDDIGTGKKPLRDCFCKESGPGKSFKTVGFYITLNLVEQMKRILSIPDIVQLLRYPRDRKKINREGIEDIFDGEDYKNMQKAGCFLSNQWNFSLTINTDGCQVGQSSRNSAWPVLITINELPPHARKRHMILAGVWVDEIHPDIMLLIGPIAEQLSTLYSTGILWKPNGTDEVCSKFVTTICCVDSVARCNILNMTQFNGKYGCPFCYARGLRCGLNLDWVYPVEDFRLRTDDEIRQDMDEAANSSNRVRGYRGHSTLRRLPEFNLNRGVVIDSMHNIWLGVGKKLTLKLLDAKSTDPWYIHNKTTFETLINNRLRKIPTPSKIARKPRGVEYCHVWKAHEWRNWILYYCVPYLKDIIPDEYFQLFSYLSEAAHILNNESIKMEEINKARLLIETFVERYQDVMGLINMTYNSHILRHVPDCVTHWGPLWTHSAFIYEDFNRQIILSLKSPKGRQLQIMNQYLLNDFVRNVKNDPIIDPEIQQIVTDILNAGKKKVFLNRNEFRHTDEFQGIGNPIVREPCAGEVTFLRREGQTCNGTLKIFEKSIIRGLSYVSEEGDNCNAQSCDKYVFTKGKDFARMEAIVSFRNNEGITTNGAFVAYFAITGNCGAGHVHTLRESTMGFIKTENLLTQAVIIKVNKDTYGVKMTNMWETD